MAKAIKSGTTVRIAEVDEVYDVLPPGFYTLAFNKDSGFFLVEREPFQLPSKIYSNPSKYVERFLKTYHSLGRGIGVLLSGEKGSGKTLLAKMLALRCQMPVIIIPSAYSGAYFQNWIASLGTPCLFFVDEFEKIYNDKQAKEEGDTGILGLLDGAALDPIHLWVLTSNKPNVGEYLMGRPGRIRYHVRFAGLALDVVEAVINDRLLPEYENYRKDLIVFISRMGGTTMDILVSLIDEINIHGESPLKFGGIFNTQVMSSDSYAATVKVEVPVIPPAFESEEFEQHHIRAYLMSLKSCSEAEVASFKSGAAVPPGYDRGLQKKVHETLFPYVTFKEIALTCGFSGYAHCHDYDYEVFWDISARNLRPENQEDEFLFMRQGFGSTQAFSLEEVPSSEITFGMDGTISAKGGPSDPPGFKITLTPAKPASRSYA